ncbi:MAG: ABC transporter ATP-binding protein [Candidatus Izemoplasma sp.]
MNNDNIKLKVEDLTISFRTVNGMVRAVRGVTFDLYEGETLAIVGESGSGKSVTSRAIMGILAGNGIIEDGKIIYENEDLTKVDEAHFHELRGNKIGMIFQDPMSSLNPIMKIGKQITEGMILNGKHLENKYKNMFHTERMIVKNLKRDKKGLSSTNREAKREFSIDPDSPVPLKRAEMSTKRKEFRTDLREAKRKLKVTKRAAKKAIKKEWHDEKVRVSQVIKSLRSDRSNSADVRKQIANERELLRRYKQVTRKEAFERAIQVMTEVGIPEPDRRIKQYPFQFSGGMRQRIVIAIALTANPDVLICDEPTTALDVTIQSQILELINKIKEERNLTVIFITHDLGVVANMANRIGVMYAGKIVELGTSEDIFYEPRHPYTWALLSSMPDLSSKERLSTIPGTPPNMLFPPKGDAFADRNKFALKIDKEEQPPMFKISDTHSAATWLLHPDAPQVDVPQTITDRIARMKKLTEEVGK